MESNTKKIIFDVSYATFLKTILIGLLLVFLYLVRDLLLIMVVAIVIASSIDSWVDWLQKKRVPRWLSVLLIFSVLIGLIVLVFSLLIPRMETMIAKPSHRNLFFSKGLKDEPCLGSSANCRGR